VAAYPTNDGLLLVRIYQVPPSTNNDFNIDASEYQRVQVCTLTVRGCEPPLPCVADFNDDGGIDGSDFGAFFTAWEEALPASDVNFDGGIDGTDIEVFFSFWESGSC